MTEAEIFNALKNILPQVAPLKVVGPVFPHTSLAKDLDFDSLDIVEMLVAINGYFSINVNFEEWILKESQRDGKSYTVGSLCQCIAGSMNKD